MACSFQGNCSELFSAGPGINHLPSPSLSLFFFFFLASLFFIILIAYLLPFVFIANSSRKMSTSDIVNSRNTAIVIPLLFVPIAVLLFCVLLAVGCANYWTAKPETETTGTRYCRWHHICHRHKRKKERSSNSSQSHNHGSASCEAYVADIPFQCPVSERGDQQV